MTWPDLPRLHASCSSSSRGNPPARDEAAEAKLADRDETKTVRQPGSPGSPGYLSALGAARDAVASHDSRYCLAPPVRVGGGVRERIVWSGEKFHPSEGF